MKISFVIPTYNEHGNISRLIEEINKVSKENNYNYEIIVVDDNSIDGTIHDIHILQNSQKNIHLIVREKLMGIGTAHIEGYNYAKGDLIISMDADLSHPTEKIPEFVLRIKNGKDMVMSSRYIPGGESDTRFSYYILSKLGGYYLSAMLKINIKDFSTGYRAIKKQLWEKIKDYKYSKKNLFLIESVYYAYKHGAKLSEVPIYFKDREIGNSKTSMFREAIKALFLPLNLRILWKRRYLLNSNMRRFF
ncbi:MAG: glycosyltransferase [Promethearchaeota archaeon]